MGIGEKGREKGRRNREGPGIKEGKKRIVKEGKKKGKQNKTRMIGTK